MSSSARRLSALVIVVALVGVAGAGTAAVGRYRDRSARTLVTRLAGAARDSARDAIEAHLAELSSRASGAAQREPLRNMVDQPEAADAQTLEDGFAASHWLGNYEGDFPAIAFFIDRQPPFGLGIEPGDPAIDALQKAAREKGRAHAVVLVKGVANIAAATVVEPHGPFPQRGVFVGARPADAALVGELASRAKGAVLLTDGRGVLVAAGDPAERALLATAIGKESVPVVEAPDLSWGASSASLMPGLWLWAFASAAGPVGEVVASATNTILVIWAFAALLSAIALFFGLRASAVPPETALAGVSQQLAAAQAALAALGGQTGRAGSTPPGPPQASAAPPSASESTLQHPLPTKPNNVFGRYYLLDRLGEGGMAEVFTAVAYGAENFKRTFVVKRLRPEMARRKDVVTQFIDEAKLASSLVHSNIIPVFDFGKVGDEYFMATEYILGRDVTRLTRRAAEKLRAGVPIKSALFVAHELARALDYAHTRTTTDGKPLGVVHRDVSSNNVIVSARGEVKLFDFGIAKSAEREFQTEGNLVKGNVRFMAPEQARGQPLDARADLYAAGLVLYFMLAGRPLFDGDQTLDLLHKAAKGPGPEEMAKLAALPRPAPQLLAKALQPNPAHRYQTAAEFVAALAPFQQGGQTELARLMDHLFAGEIKAEETKFAAASRDATHLAVGGPEEERT